MPKNAKNCPKIAQNGPKLVKIAQNWKVTSATIISTLCAGRISISSWYQGVNGWEGNDWALGHVMTGIWQACLLAAAAAAH